MGERHRRLRRPPRFGIVVRVMWRDTDSPPQKRKVRPLGHASRAIAVLTTAVETWRRAWTPRAASKGVWPAQVTPGGPVWTGKASLPAVADKMPVSRWRVPRLPIRMQ